MVLIGDCLYNCMTCHKQNRVISAFPSQQKFLLHAGVEGLEVFALPLKVPAELEQLSFYCPHTFAPLAASFFAGNCFKSEHYIAFYEFDLLQLRHLHFTRATVVSSFSFKNVFRASCGCIWVLYLSNSHSLALSCLASSSFFPIVFLSSPLTFLRRYSNSAQRSSFSLCYGALPRQLSHFLRKNDSLDGM